MKKAFGLLMAVGFAATLLAQGKIPVAVDAIENEAGATKANLQQLANIKQRVEAAIVNTRKFQVVERDKMGALLKEQNLADAGIVNADDPNAPKAGNVKAAGYLIYGTVLFMGEDHTITTSKSTADLQSTHKVELQIKLTNAETAEILAQKTVTGYGTRTAHSDANTTTGTDQFSGDHSLSLACQDAATKVATMLLELAFPSKVMGIEGSTLSINVTQELCELDQVWEIIDEGEEKFDPDTGESLGRTEKVLGRVKIVRQGPKMSQAEPYAESGFMEKVREGMLVRRVDPKILEREAAAIQKERERAEAEAKQKAEAARKERERAEAEAKQKAHAEQKEADKATTSRLSGGKKLYVSVMDIENDAGASKASLQQLANVKDRITDAIINTRKFSVVERAAIGNILKEQNMQANSGVVDKNDPNAVQRGKIKAVGYVLYGKILFMGADKAESEGLFSSKKEYSHRVEIQVRLTDAESGEILFSRKVTGKGVREEKQDFTSKSGANDHFSGDHTLSLACQDAATKIAAMLLEAAFPARIMNIDGSDITIGVPGEMTQIGALWEVVKAGEEMIDEDTGESLGKVEKVIGRIKITRVQEKFSQAEPVGIDPNAFEKGMLVRRINDSILEAENAAEAKKQEAKKNEERKKQAAGFLTKLDIEIPGINDAPPAQSVQQASAATAQPAAKAPDPKSTNEMNAEADDLAKTNAKTEEQIRAEAKAAGEDYEARLQAQRRLEQEIEEKKRIAHLNRPMFLSLDWPKCYATLRDYVAVTTNNAVAYFIATPENTSDAEETDVAALDFAFLDFLSASLAFNGFEKWVYNKDLDQQMAEGKGVTLKSDDGKDAFVICRFPLKRIAVYPQITDFSREKDTTTQNNMQWKSETTIFKVELRFLDLATAEPIGTATVEGHGMITGKGEKGTVRFTNYTSSPNRFVQNGSSLADACADTAYEMVWAVINQNFAGRIIKVGKNDATIDFGDSFVKEKDVFDVIEDDAENDPDEDANVIGRVVVVEVSRKSSKVEPYKNSCALDDISEGMRLRKVSRYTLRNERGIGGKKRKRD